MPSQDSEEAAEFVATVRTEHSNMKAWFQTSSNDAVMALRTKYGDYPALWKEVLNWDGWKETRKEYMKEQQLRERDDATAKQQQQQQYEQEPLPRKRKSRWGKADDATSTADSAADDASRRSSRWGSADTAAPQHHQAPPPPSFAPVLLPGLHALPADKTNELEQLRGRLREANRIIENVDELAAKVDDLPRGHRDRSPSPPPGTYSVQYLIG